MWPAANWLILCTGSNLIMHTEEWSVWCSKVRYTPNYASFSIFNYSYQTSNIIMLILNKHEAFRRFPHLDAVTTYFIMCASSLAFCDAKLLNICQHQAQLQAHSLSLPLQKVYRTFKTFNFVFYIDNSVCLLLCYEALMTYLKASMNEINCWIAAWL